MFPGPIPIALVDDHTLFRNALAALMEGDTRFQVVAQAAHGADYLRVVKDGLPVAVAVVDLHMPVMDGYETMAWIRANTPATRALALSLDLEPATRTKALAAGACGFLRKDCNKDQFLDALLQVALLGVYEPAPLEAPRTNTSGANRRSALLSKLTQRELEYLQLVCQNGDYTTEQLADLMQVQRRTVDGYRESVYKKCEVHSKAGLVVVAYKWGIIG